MVILAEQWPLLAAFVTIYGSTLLFIKGLYDGIITDLRERVNEERQTSKESAALLDKLADRVESAMAVSLRLEEYLREQGRRA